LLGPILWGNIGKVSLVEPERRVRDKIEVALTASKFIKAWKVELREI
jgi:hypothetical protein